MEYFHNKKAVFPSPARIIIPARLVSDIPAGDGKTANLFLQCTWQIWQATGEANITELGATIIA
jgi:hypothetical protein